MNLNENILNPKNPEDTISYGFDMYLSEIT
jgi:hypothetical protein